MYEPVEILQHLCNARFCLYELRAPKNAQFMLTELAGPEHVRSSFLIQKRAHKVGRNQ